MCIRDRSTSATESLRPAYFGADYGTIDTPVYRRCELTHGARGPLLIDEYDSTIVVPPSMRAALDEDLNIRLESADV